MKEPIYIDRLGSQIRSHLDPELLPESDSTLLFRIYAVLLLAKGSRVTTQDVHNAWVAWMSSQNLAHPALIPYPKLDRLAKEADEPFRQAIAAVAQEMNSSSDY